MLSGSADSTLACSSASFDRGSSAAPDPDSLASRVADRAEITRAEAERLFDALDEVVLAELGDAQKVRIGGLIQVTVRVKPAQRARKGRNPATGEHITIAAKPQASMCGRVRWPRPRLRCRASRKPAGDWLRRRPETSPGPDQGRLKPGRLTPV
ncbi:MAG: HU family DNA-binding protein [Solirubrobacteraceae bacterium]